MATTEADPDVVEEWKWVKATSPGTPVWSHKGAVKNLICEAVALNLERK